MSRNRKILTNICGSVEQKFRCLQGKSSYTSSEYLLNLRSQIFTILNCFCLFFFRIFTAVGKPLEELRKTMQLEELSDSFEERSKNKTAVSADKEVRGRVKGSGKLSR